MLKKKPRICKFFNFIGSRELLSLDPKILSFTKILSFSYRCEQFSKTPAACQDGYTSSLMITEVKHLELIHQSDG